MIFTPITVAGAWLIDPEFREDERGFLARTYCEREFAGKGLNIHWPQCNLNFTRRRSTLRGMHYQLAPHGETKLLRCSAGAVHDVIVDLRPDSPTFRRWHALGLDARSHRMLYVPAGCAHGFLTLTDDSEVFYQMSDFYHPESARGVRWNDRAFAIEWPAVDQLVISERDRNFPDFRV